MVFQCQLLQNRLFARYISHDKEERVHAASVLAGPAISNEDLDQDVWIEYVRQALYMGKICAYAQGFTQYKMTSELNDWNLPLKDIALNFPWRMYYTGRISKHN